jgi:hypothetical protein
MEYRFQYLRNRDGQPVGCVAIKTIVSESGCRIEYQVSALSPLDRFDRSLARNIAVERLKKRPLVVESPLNHDANMHQITSAVMTHLSNTPISKKVVEGVVIPWEVKMNVPSRARKAAKLWLQEHTGTRQLQLAHGVYS